MRCLSSKLVAYFLGLCWQHTQKYSKCLAVSTLLCAPKSCKINRRLCLPQLCHAPLRTPLFVRSPRSLSCCRLPAKVKTSSENCFNVRLTDRVCVCVCVCASPCLSRACFVLFSASCALFVRLIRRASSLVFGQLAAAFCLPVSRSACVCMCVCTSNCAGMRMRAVCVCVSLRLCARCA